MMLDEITPVTATAGENPDSITSQVCLLNATAKWSDKISEPTLSEISATFKSGQLLAVVGPVGAGKVRQKLIWFRTK
jgi:ABC-type multidrug transport system fused ATPase/permease subunit